MQAGRSPTLEEVAEAAMVSRATAYRYFPGVEALLTEAALDVAMPEADSFFVVQTGELIDENVGDNDADDGPLFCTSTPVSVSDPVKVEYLEIGFGCDFSFDPVNSATGPLTVEYEVCDAHTLANPDFPAPIYGADDREPGDLARRCSVETIAPSPWILWAPATPSRCDRGPSRSKGWRRPRTRSWWRSAIAGP